MVKPNKNLGGADMNLDEFNQELEDKRGKPRGYPSCLRCKAGETEAGFTLTVELLNPEEAFSRG